MALIAQSIQGRKLESMLECDVLVPLFKVR
jgi:hypothetical protein